MLNDSVYSRNFQLVAHKTYTQRTTGSQPKGKIHNSNANAFATIPNAENCIRGILDLCLSMDNM